MCVRVGIVCVLLCCVRMQSIKTSRTNARQSFLCCHDARQRQRELHRGMAAASGPRARAACMHATDQPEGAGV
jgi:hypothetical protein